MSEFLTRRSALQLTGAVGLTGIFGALGALPAHAYPGDSATMLQKMQGWSDILNMANVGYDQGNRWSFLDKKNRTIKWDKECDCSSSCGAIAWLAGYPIKDIGGSLNTTTFPARFKAAGFKIIDYKNLSQVKVGDFVVTRGHHVVFARDSKRWWSAEHDEHGNESGGKAGDQTGSECRYRAPYVRSGGWEYIVRRP